MFMLAFDYSVLRASGCVLVLTSTVGLLFPVCALLPILEHALEGAAGTQVFQRTKALLK